MLSPLQLAVRSDGFAAFEALPSAGGVADALIAAHQGPRGLDTGGLARELVELRAEDPGLSAATRSAVEARLTPVERGDLGRAIDATHADATIPSNIAGGLNAGSGGQSPQERQAIATAFRRELDSNRAALEGTAPMSAATRAARTELQQTGELALLNIDVYHDQSIASALPRGFTALSDAQATAQFPGFVARDDNAGFYSRIYHNANTDTHVVVNRGTNDAHAVVGILRQTPDGGTNWNLMNGNRTAQADYAIDNARAVSAGTDGRVAFSGHSLGGALASLQGVATSRPATVFNPLGLNERVFDRYTLDRAALDTQVRAYVVEGDPVATTNRFLGLERSTQTTTLPSRDVEWSANDGLRSSAGSDDAHSLTAVVGGLLHRANAAR